MVEQSKIDRLIKLDEQLFGRRNVFAPLSKLPPFDIEKPNIHDSKGEYLKERNAVQALIEQSSKMIQALLGASEKPDEDQRRLLARLSTAVNTSVREHNQDRKIETAADLVQMNFIETNYLFNMLRTLFDLRLGCQSRLAELEVQEDLFWSVSNRPPNYYARFIALRFARRWAETKLARPTIGTARDGGHPSTDFGRALETVFEILEIKGRVRGPAEWAISQLTENDWSPKPVNALASLHPNNIFQSAPASDPKAEIARLLSKRPAT